MPTSVLLAVLAAAGLLALAPALVRRYDATERLVAERALSTARVLHRQPPSPHRARTAPVNPPRSLAGRRSTAAARRLRRPLAPARPPPARRRRRRRPRRAAPRRRRARHTPAIYRRRRVLAALLLLNVIELVGVVSVGPGFWIGFAVTGTLLVATSCTCATGRWPSAGGGAMRGPGGGLARRAAGGGTPGAGPPARPPAARRSAGWPPSGRRYAARRWAWTGTVRLPAAADGARCPTAAAGGCAAGRTRPAAGLGTGVTAARDAGRGPIRGAGGRPVSLIAGPRAPGGDREGLWRRPVAHLVRIEGVRGSNPLSSTQIRCRCESTWSGVCDLVGSRRGSALTN